jgi:cation transport ATPase
MTRALKAVAAAAFFVTAAAGWSGAADRDWPDLTSGRYEVRLEGMLCHSCARAIVDQVITLKEVEKASADFEQETLYVTIRPDATLTAKKLRKSLRKAAHKVDLDTKFDIANVRYKGREDEGPSPAKSKKKTQK